MENHSIDKDLLDLLRDMLLDEGVFMTTPAVRVIGKEFMCIGDEFESDVVMGSVAENSVLFVIIRRDYALTRANIIAGFTQGMQKLFDKKWQVMCKAGIRVFDNALDVLTEPLKAEMADMCIAVAPHSLLLSSEDETKGVFQMFTMQKSDIEYYNRLDDERKRRMASACIRHRSVGDRRWCNTDDAQSILTPEILDALI